MSVRFSNQMVPEVVQPFWAALQRGEFSYRCGCGGRDAPVAGVAVAT